MYVADCGWSHGSVRSGGVIGGGRGGSAITYYGERRALIGDIRAGLGCGLVEVGERAGLLAASESQRLGDDPRVRGFTLAAAAQVAIHDLLAGRAVSIESALDPSERLDVFSDLLGCQAALFAVGDYLINSGNDLVDCGHVGACQKCLLCLRPLNFV